MCWLSVLLKSTESVVIGTARFLILLFDFSYLPTYNANASFSRIVLFASSAAVLSYSSSIASFTRYTIWNDPNQIWDEILNFILLVSWASHLDFSNKERCLLQRRHFQILGIFEFTWSPKNHKKEILLSKATRVKSKVFLMILLKSEDRDPSSLLIRLLIAMQDQSEEVKLLKVSLQTYLELLGVIPSVNHSLKRVMGFIMQMERWVYFYLSSSTHPTCNSYMPVSLSSTNIR